MNLKKFLTKLTNSNLSLAVYAIIIAIISWFVVSMTYYPSVSKTIEEIPVVLDLSGSPAADNGLSVISCDVDTVDVELKVSRTQNYSLTAENLVAYVDFGNVSTPGKKKLEIKLRSTNGVNYEVKSISQPTATVTLDKFATVRLPISPRIPNVSFADGKTVDPNGLNCVPDMISITGPSAQLEKIASCYAVSNRTLTLDSSYSLSNDAIQLISEDGAQIDLSDMTFDTPSFVINIPVLTQKTVRPVVQLLNVPADFDQSCIDFTYSTESITIASNNSLSEIPDTIEICKIPLSDLVIGYSRSVDISSILESSGMINQSGIDMITVTLNSEGLATKEITLDQSNLHLSNTPNDNYDYNIITQKLNITVVGPEDIINDLTPNNFVADANLLNADTSLEQFNYDVSVSCLNHDNVWAVTSAKVSIQKTLKEDAAVTTSGASASNSTSSTTTG